MTQEQDAKYNRFHSLYEKVLEKYAEAHRAITFGSELQEAAVVSYTLYATSFKNWVKSDKFLSTQSGTKHACQMATAAIDALTLQRENMKEF